MIRSTESSMSRNALRGALTGLALALLVAAPMLIFSDPPGPIEANAFAAYVDATGSPAVESPVVTSERAYALNH